MSRSLVSLVRAAFNIQTVTSFRKTCHHGTLTRIQSICKASFCSNLQTRSCTTLAHPQVNLQISHNSARGKFLGDTNIFLRTSDTPQCHCSAGVLQQKHFGTKSFHTDAKLHAIQNIREARVNFAQPPPKLKKKKKARLRAEVKDKKVIAYATSDEYDTDKLRMTLTEQGWYKFTQLHQDMGDVLHATPNYKVSDCEREIFFFENGTVIFWDVPDTEIEEVIKFLRLHGDGTYDVELSDSETESMEYRIDENSNTNFSKDVLTLSSKDDADLMLSEKFTCSNILSHSVKLAIWETKVGEFLDQMDDLTKDLRLGKGLKNIKRKEVFRMIGEAYEYRQKIHSSDLQDTPDYYWDREELELLYNRLHNVFTIKKRTLVLMEKLDYCCDLLNLIDSKLSDQTHVRLEWYIIALILLEVLRLQDTYGNQRTAKYLV